MSMKSISVRLPRDVVAAFDAADANRSQLIRRLLTDAIADGQVEVPDDLRTLARRESAVDHGRLPRKRSTFKKRAYDHFADAWDHGAVTASDAEDMAESWSREAAIYGREQIAFIDSIVGWYVDHYSVPERPEWPAPDAFVARADPDQINIPDRLTDSIETRIEAETTDHRAVEAHVDRLTQIYGEEIVSQALNQIDHPISDQVAP